MFPEPNAVDSRRAPAASIEPPAAWNQRHGWLGRDARAALKAPIHALIAEWQRRRFVRRGRRAIDAYLRAQPIRRLHLGAGDNVLAGWLNTDLTPRSGDIAYLDICQPLPFRDGTFDRIFSEHLIEHVPHADAAVHLAECRRVLKPGGRIRISTPNLQFLVAMYTRPKPTDVEDRYIERTITNEYQEAGFHHPAFVVNNFVRNWGHQFIYDPATLAAALTHAGFRDVVQLAVQQSDDREFRGIEHHGDAISNDFNLLQTMVFEATR